MRITKKDIEHMADFAMLYLNEEEKELYTEELNGILNQIEKLGELDTKDVEPTVHLLPLKNVWREDKIEPSLESEQVFKNTENGEEGFFRVPKIIED
jgi:aspartyl-tRNA(Asn)/glutamyl-tRNA(Gln) amidotransferase subunit C